MTSGEFSAQAVVEGLYGALAAGDVPAIKSFLHDDFVGWITPGLPFGIGGEHRGVDAMIEDAWFPIGAHWRIRAVPEAFALLHDGRLHVEGCYRGTSRSAGLPVDAPYVHDFTFRDERIVKLTQLTDSALFLQALGDERPLQRVDLDIEDGVATLRLNRPEARNALDQAAADELLDVSLRLGRDSRVRAVLICGEGPALTVGGDVRQFSTNPDVDLGRSLHGMATPYHLALQTLDVLDVPIVTAAHGSIAGGGLGLVYAADIVIAADDARFVTAFSHLGITGDGGGTWHLPRLIGPARAARAYLLSEPMSAHQAQQWGLISEVVPLSDLRQRARAVAGQLAQGPTRAYGQMRKLLRESWDRSLPDQLHAETAALVTSARTLDARNAVAAFVAKQEPAFEGE